MKYCNLIGLQLTNSLGDGHLASFGGGGGGVGAHLGRVVHLRSRLRHQSEAEARRLSRLFLPSVVSVDVHVWYEVGQHLFGRLHHSVGCPRGHSARVAETGSFI